MIGASKIDWCGLVLQFVPVLSPPVVFQLYLQYSFPPQGEVKQLL